MAKNLSDWRDRLIEKFLKLLASLGDGTWCLHPSKQRLSFVTPNPQATNEHRCTFSMVHKDSIESLLTIFEADSNHFQRFHTQQL